MTKKTNSLLRKTVLTLMALLLLTGQVHAYAGPVAGPETVGYLMSVLAWLSVACSSLILWPIHAFWRRLRGRVGVTTCETSAPLDTAPESELEHTANC